MQITPYPDTPILTLNRTGVMVVMLGEGGVTVERMDMAEGERGDKGRVMSDRPSWCHR